MSVETMAVANVIIGHAAVMLQEFWQDGQHANVPEAKLGVGVSVCFQCQMR